MKQQKRQWIGFFLLLLTVITVQTTLAPAAQADSSALSIYASQTIAVDACHSATYTMQIATNTPGAQKVFIKTKQQRANEWIVYDPSSFLLTPGEQQQVTVHVRVPCRIEGNFPLEFIVTDGVTEYIIEQELQVTRRNNIGVAPFANAMESCPCQPQTRTINVRNIAGVPDVFRFEATGPGAPYVTIAPQAKILFPGQSQNILIVTNTPCDLNGRLDFNINVETDNAGFGATLPFTYDIQACYDFGLTVPAKVSACLDEQTTFYVNVTNEMHFTNTYEIDVDPFWADSVDVQIPLDPDQKGIIPVTVTPLSEDLGRFEALDFLTLKVTEQIDNQHITYEIPVETNVCYDVDIQGPQEQEFLCPGTTTLELAVSNYGSYDQVFVFDLQGPEFLALQEGALEIPAGQIRTTNIIANVPTEDIPFDEEFDVNLLVQVGDAPLVYDELLFTVTPVDRTSCYQLNIAPNRFPIGAANESYVLNVSHVGYQAATYQLFTNNSFGVSPQISTFTLEPGQSIGVPLNVDPAQTQGYEVIFDAVFEEIAYQSIVRFTSFPWWIILLLILLLLFLIIILILLAIVVRKSPSKDKEQQTLTEATTEATKEKPKKKSVKENKPKKQVVADEDEDEISSEEEVLKEARKSSKGWSWWWIILIIILLLLLLLGIFFGPRDTNTQDNLNNLNETNTTNNDTFFEDDQTDDQDETPPPVDKSQNQTQNITETGPPEDIEPEGPSEWQKFWTWWGQILAKAFQPVEDPQPTNETDTTQGNDTMNNQQTNQQVIQNITIVDRQEEIDQLNQTVSELDAVIAQQQAIIDNQNQIIEELSTIEGPLTQRQIDILVLEETLNRIELGLGDSFLYQVMTESETLTVDLAELFADPDGDELFFTAFEPPELDFNITDAQITITPEPGYIGVAYTVFYARDNDGALAQSPIVSIVVVPEDFTREAAQLRASGVDTSNIDELLAQLTEPAEIYEKPTSYIWVWALLGIFIFIIIVIIIVVWLYELSEKNPDDKEKLL